MEPLEGESASDRDLMARLAAGGVDVAHGFEAAVVSVEANPEHAELRESVWKLLIDELAASRALIQPLTDLYGS